MDDLLCFIGQKAFIEKEGKLLILHDPQMGLDMPGGKILVEEENLQRSLQREVLEETGLRITVGLPFYTWLFTVPVHSGHRSAGKKIFSVAYRCTYVAGDITLSREHDWYKWVTKETYKEFTKDSNFAAALQEYFTV